MQWFGTVAAVRAGTQFPKQGRESVAAKAPKLAEPAGQLSRSKVRSGTRATEH